MATKTTKKQLTQERTLTIGGNVYVQPKAEIDAYLHYLEVRDSVMDTESKAGLYTAKQFRDMMDCIVEMYGNQFTVAEMTDKETGLSVSDIIVEFAAIEIGIGQNVNQNVEQMQENFMKGE